MRPNDQANAVRGEATIMVNGQARMLRPTFTSLVAAEDELGSLYSLVERTSEGQLRLSEIAALFWHCLADKTDISRDEVSESVIATGLVANSAPLRALLFQILQGRA